MTLKSHYTNDLVTINANEVPEIGFDRLIAPSLEEPWIHQFSINFQLADLRDSTKNVLPGISILIGADYYWKIVTSNTCQIKYDLMGVATKFGWTIHGVPR